MHSWLLYTQKFILHAFNFSTSKIHKILLRMPDQSGFVKLMFLYYILQISDLYAVPIPDFYEQNRMCKLCTFHTYIRTYIQLSQCHHIVMMISMRPQHQLQRIY